MSPGSQGSTFDAVRSLCRSSSQLCKGLPPAGAGTGSSKGHRAVTGRQALPDGGPTGRPASSRVMVTVTVTGPPRYLIQNRFCVHGAPRAPGRWFRQERSAPPGSAPPGSGPLGREQEAAPSPAEGFVSLACHRGSQLVTSRPEPKSARRAGRLETKGRRCGRSRARGDPFCAGFPRWAAAAHPRERETVCSARSSPM